MKRREVQRLVRRYIAPHFPELTPSGDMLARWDGDPIVRGFVFERHPYFVRLYAYAQPLFVPADITLLSVAEPLGEFVFDDAAEEGVLAEDMLRRAEGEGRAFLQRVSDCSSLAETVLDIPGDRMDERHGLEIRAYCLLWTGRADEAAAQLDAAIDQLRDFKVEYELETLTRVTQVRQALERSEDEARALLEEWATKTARALKLPA